ncbi:hypothetical protein O6P43_010017 [Quillaja saponaria]|uniref:Uncharacterized protein n=1 Tax=Quillaja saponaria TaxID=32244 RepID=A0AAD7PZJ0_QUISA|nr:hypothetical protein O6P43_010017 [Quillaja saponaria]
MWFSNRILRASIAKYGWKARRPQPPQTRKNVSSMVGGDDKFVSHRNNEQRKVWKNFMNDGRFFNEILTNGGPIHPSKVHKVSGRFPDQRWHENANVEFNGKSEEMEWLQRSAVGRVKSVGLASTIKEHFAMEGFCSCFVRYMRGQQCSLTMLQTKVKGMITWSIVTRWTKGIGRMRLIWTLATSSSKEGRVETFGSPMAAGSNESTERQAFHPPLEEVPAINEYNSTSSTYGNDQVILNNEMVVKSNKKLVVAGLLEVLWGCIGYGPGSAQFTIISP